jgi:hypothetical protein
VPAIKNNQPNKESATQPKTPAAQIFHDPESRRNIVGLFDLLLKMDQRNNPELYGLKRKKRDP